MSSSIQSDGWLRTSLVSMLWRRANITFLHLLSSSTRASAREDGLGEEEGGGLGLRLLGGEGLGDDVGEEDVEEGWSGDFGGLGNQEGSMNRPSKG